MDTLIIAILIIVTHLFPLAYFGTLTLDYIRAIDHSEDPKVIARLGFKGIVYAILFAACIVSVVLALLSSSL